jgi:hypothetical protein
MDFWISGFGDLGFLDFWISGFWRIPAQPRWGPSRRVNVGHLWRGGGEGEEGEGEKGEGEVEGEGEVLIYD